jgi:hypothetical protein
VSHIVCFLARQPPVGQGPLIHEFPRSHNDAPQSAELLWTIDQLVVETSTWQHTHNTHNRKSSMSLVGFEPTLPEGERPQTYAFDSAANGDRLMSLMWPWIIILFDCIQIHTPATFHAKYFLNHSQAMGYQEGLNPPSPRNANILTKLSQIPSSVEYTSITT